MAVKKGDKVKVNYVGTYDDGTEFDSSKHGDHDHPIEFIVGEGQVIKGFEDAVLGMEKDEEKTIRLEPKDAYGEHNDELIKKIKRKSLPADQKPKKGMQIVLSTPEGQQFPAQITEVTDEDITIDLNHPLAGKALNFKLTVVDY